LAIFISISKNNSVNLNLDECNSWVTFSVICRSSQRQEDPSVWGSHRRYGFLHIKDLSS